jgi:DNA-binding NarL/FixJ family response regulator
MNDTRRRIRVFLVDDHEVVREGLRRMLESCDDLEVVGGAANGEDALRLIPDATPDVVLLDLNLPGMQGLDVLAALHSKDTASPKVLVLTVHDDEDLVLGAARLGARGYVLKHTSRDELAGAIRKVAGGGHYFEEEVIGALIGADQAQDESGAITTRELEVLRLLTAGLTNKDIGERLHLSPETIKTHLGNIYRKLGVEGRAHAVAVALRRGLLD